MNWFRFVDVEESIVDMGCIACTTISDDEDDKEYFIKLFHEGDHCFTLKLLYHDKDLRDKDYDRLWQHLMKMTVVSQGYSWNLNVRDLALSHSSKEEEK